ncbi:hypothetical protein [Micromonospora carbonacea]|uniref:hypothetical protein n=1 Tax=Micromonospora carbonacea TaxID=47853 RepID=UPI003D74772E
MIDDSVIRIIDQKASPCPPVPPEHADRHRTAPTQSPALLPFRRLPAGHPGTERPHRRARPLQRQLPTETGTPLSTWSCPDQAAEVVNHGIVPAISASTIRRILATDTLKPWQRQSWIFIRDPHRAAKATRVLDLHARTYQGIPLSPDEA